MRTNGNQCFNGLKIWWRTLSNDWVHSDQYLGEYPLRLLRYKPISIIHLNMEKYFSIIIRRKFAPQQVFKPESCAAPSNVRRPRPLTFDPCTAPRRCQKYSSSYICPDFLKTLSKNTATDFSYPVIVRVTDIMT